MWQVTGESLTYSHVPRKKSRNVPPIHCQCHEPTAPIPVIVAQQTYTRRYFHRIRFDYRFLCSKFLEKKNNDYIFATWHKRGNERRVRDVRCKVQNNWQGTVKWNEKEKRNRTTEAVRKIEKYKKNMCNRNKVTFFQSCSLRFSLLTSSCRYLIQALI